MIQAGDYTQTKKMILLKQNFFKTLSPTFVGFFVCGMMGRFGNGSNRPIVSNWICSDWIIDVVFIQTKRDY